jgi:hypothetical protein
MEKKLVLLPFPRKLKFITGVCPLFNKYIILLDSDTPHSLLFSASRLQSVLLSLANLKLDINASNVVPKELVGITLRLDPQLILHQQGYSLKITPEGITIEARTEKGIFYGCITLIQIIQSSIIFHEEESTFPIGSIPCLEIHDWPDYLNRGVMLDISRDKVPSMDTIFSLIDLLASWKINQLQLYTEHTFAYQQHPEVWAEASPFTGDEILKLDGFCHKRFIELVPNQNSFGHMEPWLKLPRYKSLAEAPDGFDFPWGHHDGPFSLCPLDPGSINLISSLYDELLPHFSSHQMNVGCDETFDLGQGRSKDACVQLGIGHVYLDFLLKVYQQVKKRGFIMQFWGDVIMAHPELVNDLPKDVIILEWGYEANHPFNAHCEKLAEAKLSFYVCPGTSAWNSIAGRTDNCIMNLSNAAINGLQYGADGYLIADWGDNGHWQMLPVSYLGMAAGSAFCWSNQTNKDLDFQEALNRYAFGDSSGILGKEAFDLGNVYHEIGIEPENASALFYILQHPVQEWKELIDPERAIKAFHQIMSVVEQASINLPNTRPNRPDKELLQREFRLTVNLLQHACKRGLFGFGSKEYSRSFLNKEIQNITMEYKDIWFTRNRPGGLLDSLSYFEITRKDYR